MFRTLIRNFFPFTLLIVSAGLSATPINAVPELTGTYYILTDSKPYPLLSMNLGKVRSIYGELTDKSCDISNKGAQLYTTDLNTLFHAVEIDEYSSGTILSKHWKQNNPDSHDPFTGSAVTLNISDQAELSLIHTITTFSDNSADYGSELCQNRHQYQLRAVE